MAPTAGTNPATGRAWTDRRGLLALLVSGVLLSGGMASAGSDAAPARAAPFVFDRHEVVTGPAEHQTVLSGRFLGGPVADLAVVSVDESGERRLSIYAFGDGAWVQRLEAALGPRVRFVDVADIGGRERLISYERGRLNWFDPDSASERVLVSVTTNFNAAPDGLQYAGAGPTGPADEGEIPHVDVTRDLNRDGRDDIVIPDLDGFWVLVQTSDGGFADPVKLGPPEPFRDEIAFDDRRTYGEVGISPLTVPWYLSRIHEMDYDRDGRSDLVFWNEDHFEVYRQDARGLFSPVSETFTVDVPFDSDGAYSLLFGFRDESGFRLVSGFRKSSRRTLLHSLRDVDGDGVADLTTHSLEGRSILRQRSLYAVHFGTPTADGVAFAREVGTAIRPRGRAGALETSGYRSQWLQELDGDGQVDVVFRDVKMGLGNMIGALFGSISMRLELYRVQDGIYPAQPTSTRTIRAHFDPRGGRDAGFFPALLMGDVNGDGRSDLLLGKNRRELHVFLGVPGPELLAREPQRVAVAVPGDERNSWLVDLDRDGKQDLITHHPSATGPHRVTMLIAR